MAKIRDYVTEYAKKVVNGDIIASKKSESLSTPFR